MMSEIPCRARWWMEKELWLLVLLLGVAFFARIRDVPLRGEETRRAQAAMEMRYYHDYLVDRENGELLLSRPPLHSWVIAGSEAIFGSKDRLGLRFPSVVAVLLTSILIYGYARQFFSRLGATAAAVAFPTSGEVLCTSQLAETEALYVFFLAGSLLLWHWGYTNQWRSALTWVVAYSFAALACLCKGGLQPPVYLLGSIGLFLLWNRDLRFLFTRSHLAGLAVGLAIAATWAVPCAEHYGWMTTKRIWMSDTSSRFDNWPLSSTLWHLVEFPADSIPGVFPWCILALGLLLPGFRRMVATGPGCVQFCLFGFLLAAPTVWIPPGGKTRYLMPLYPCLAILLGAVVERILDVSIIATAWKRFLIFWAVLLTLFAGVIVAGAWILPGTRLESFTLPPLLAGIHAAVLLILAVALMKVRRPTSALAVAVGVWALTVATLEVNLGVMTDIRMNKINDIEASFARIEGLLPPDQPLVAVGDIHSDIAYCLGRVVPRPEAVDKIPEGGYFCFDRWGTTPPKFPFAWEKVAEVPVDRMRTPTPSCSVVIARRLSTRGQGGAE